MQILVAVVPAFVLLISRESAGVVKFGMAARWFQLA
jgi:hypothetical protein